MKTITINVSEPIYRDFQKLSKVEDRTTSELIRDAMRVYWETRIRSKSSLRDIEPVSVGKVKKELKPGDDILGEMLNG